MGPALDSGFLSVKRLGVLLLLPFVHLGEEEHCESKVSCLRAQHNDPGQGSYPDHSIAKQILLVSSIRNV